MTFGAFAEIIERARLGRIPLRDSLRRLGACRGRSGRRHRALGIGLTVLGIVSVTAWETELVTTLNPGETAELGGM